MILKLAALIVPHDGLLKATRAFANGQKEGHGDGTVHFATSCDKAVQDRFDHGVALLHSFWFSASIEAFKDVLGRDPTCAIAEWGIAMSEWGNPFTTSRTPAVLAAGLAAITRAETIGPKTERERMYVAAAKLLYSDAGSIDERTRTIAYEQAMFRLTEAYPEDLEARAFYALAIGQDIDPTDKSFRQRLEAGAILERDFANRPDHPGLAHYIIHSYDVPSLAPRALVAARRYAIIAPDAPHALHMAAHTFTRLGLWQESIDANIRSAAAAARDPNAAAEQLHALDYMVYAYLQTGQDRAALALLTGIDRIGSEIRVDVPGNAAPPSAGYYAMASIPARYAIERNMWSEAAALPPRDTPFAWVDAVTYFARGLGSARIGNLSDAAENLAILGHIRNELLEERDLYWSRQVEIQMMELGSLISLGEGKSQEALFTLRAAADAEDATDKSVITPGPLKPGRELLAETLLRLDRPAESLAEFERVMQKEPGRFHAIYGAALAASVSGDEAKAEIYYAQLIEVCARGDLPGRLELQAARNHRPR
jgi:hypothetical protein